MTVVAFALGLVPAAASAATIEVNSQGNNVANDGECTLREAITAANTNSASGPASDECVAGQAEPTVDLIQFDPSVVSIIVSGSALPSITEQVTLDGGGAVVRGAATPPAGSGLILSVGSDGSTIRDLTVAGFDSTSDVAGVAIVLSDGNTLHDLDVSTGGGASDRNSIGVSLVSADDNVIRDNVIHNNSDEGVRLSSSAGNALRGNTIGVGGPTTEDEIGVEITGGSSDGNTIGGASLARRNIIADNLSHGIVVTNTGSTNPIENLTIRNNRIGTTEDGEAADANGGSGIEMHGAVSGAEIRDNLISGNDGSGIIAFASAEQVADAPGPSDNVIAGNTIGTDDDGEALLLNGGDGIHIAGTAAHPATGNVVGGTSGLAVDGDCTGDCNLIVAADGDDSVMLLSEITGTQVLGNFVGIDHTGSSDFDSGERGIVLDGADETQVGTAAAGNLVGGQAAEGIALDGADDNTVQDNGIGLGLFNQVLPNGGPGIGVTSSSRNLIGGTGPDDGNRIHLSGIGVEVASGIRNSILGNEIFFNLGGLAIDLGPTGVTPNDPDDLDAGANNLQNFPVLRAAVADSSTTIVGTLDSIASTTFRIETFASAADDPSGHGEAPTFLGAFEVTTDENGDASFAETVEGETAGAQNEITATATRLNDAGEPLGTSELAENVVEGCDVTGTEGDDPALVGTGADEVICGLGGDDEIDGGGGDDVILGGAGDDELDYSSAGGAIEADLGAGTVTGAGAGDDFAVDVEDLSGTDFDDVVTGDGAGNVFRGRDGEDTLKGGDGADTLKGGDQLDVLKGQDDQDKLRGGGGKDELRGSDGDGDDLEGDEGKDSLNGGPGDDDDCHGGPDADETPAPGCEIESSIP